MGRVSLQRMRAVSVAAVQQQVQRKEGTSDLLVLVDVTQLVTPDLLRRLASGHHDVTEGDRGVAASREDQAREAAIADVEETPVAPARKAEREQSDEVADRIGVVSDELSHTFGGGYGC